MPAEPLPQLTPTSYVVLGLIGLRGPSTPYELEVAVDKSVAYFWSFPHSQLYREPDRLREFGLLAVDQETTGRRRKVFDLTSLGRTALESWLASSVDKMFEMRDEAVLQLFFSDRLTDRRLVEIARHEIDLREQRLETYRQIQESELPHHGQDRRMAPLRLGIKLAEASRDFWLEIENDPPPPTSTLNPR